MKKYIVSIVSLLILVVPQTVFASFTDVSSDYHLYDSINWLQEQGVVVGYSDGTYRPDDDVNRVEFLKMLY